MSVYKGHIRVPVTLSIAEGLASGAVTTCDLGLSGLRFEHPTFRLQSERSNSRRQSGQTIVLFDRLCIHSFNFICYNNIIISRGIALRERERERETERQRDLNYQYDIY